MILEVDVDDEAWVALPGAASFVEKAAAATFSKLGMDMSGKSLAIVLSDDASVAELNGQWRDKLKPTNVLSFPADSSMPVPPGEPRPLGGIIFASGVVQAEARDQGKRLEDHFSHLVVHGILHIMGYDHIEDEQAGEMEGLETEILASLGIADPYA
jgi:probable rRNA maturation factor